MNEDRPSQFEVALDQTPAPMPEPSEAEQIADTLAEYGIEPTTAQVVAVERLVHRLAFRLASEGWRRLLRSLGQRPVNRALERVILGDGGKSLADDAGEVGCSKQNLDYHIKRLQKRLSHLTAEPLIEHERDTIRASGQRGRPKAGQRSRH